MTHFTHQLENQTTHLSPTMGQPTDTTVVEIDCAIIRG